MNVTPKYDVIIVGAGPVGITTACTLKALNKDLQICVLDKRPETTRKHGLRIANDSVTKIHNVLQQSLSNPEDAALDRDNIQKLDNIFQNWRTKVVRTNVIESTMAEKAQEMGITVLRGPDYEITEQNLDPILADEADEKLLSEKEQKLHKIFQSAKVIIGSDSSHSVIRKKVMGDKLVHERILQYLIELKYQTKGSTRPRSYKESSYEASKCAAVAFETMGKEQDANVFKPATYHLFTDLQTYEKLRQLDDKGKVVKGDFANPWTLKEVRELGRNDKQVKHVSDTLYTYLRRVEERGGDYKEEKITTLPMKLYRSEETVKIYKNRYFVLDGDANSGLVLERGFNKGLKEAALCAKAVSDLFKRIKNNPDCLFDVEKTEVYGFMSSVNKIANELLTYQRQTRKIFANEAFGAKSKNSGLTSVQFSLSYVVTPIVNAYQSITSLFTKSSYSSSLKPVEDQG